MQCLPYRQRQGQQTQRNRVLREKPLFWKNSSTATRTHSKKINAENWKSCCFDFPSAENTLPCPNALSTIDGWLFAPHTC